MNEENKEEKFELYLVLADMNPCLRYENGKKKIMGFHRDFHHHSRLAAEQECCAMIVGEEGVVISAALTETPT